jgi:hypothetical protein
MSYEQLAGAMCVRTIFRGSVLYSAIEGIS